MEENQTGALTPKTDWKKFFPLILIGIALIIVLGASFYLNQSPSTTTDTPNPSEATTTPEGSNPGYKIEEIPLETIESIMPNLSRPISFSSSVPQEVRTLLTQKRDQLAAKLKDDPTNGGNWLDLAIQYHTANDFEGARLIWEFLTKGLANDPIAFDNLGKLYHFSTPDYPKAEGYFKQSMAINPKSTLPYMELHDLYKYSYKKDTTEAIDILKQGASAFPENIDFPVMIGLDYRDRGDIANARIWLNKGMDLAHTKGDTAAQSKIGDELSKLPQ